MRVAGFSGYTERLLCNGMKCWCILRWVAPEVLGTPLTWEMENYDPVTGLSLLGPFPEKGTYEIAVPLLRRYIEDGKTLSEAMPLSYAVIDFVIPLLLKAQEMTVQERLIAKQLNEEAEERALNTLIADRMADALPSFYGPVSYENQRIKTALIDRKMEQIQRVWDRLTPADLERIRRTPKGVRQLN